MSSTLRITVNGDEIYGPRCNNHECPAQKDCGITKFDFITDRASSASEVQAGDDGEVIGVIAQHEEGVAAWTEVGRLSFGMLTLTGQGDSTELLKQVPNHAIEGMTQIAKAGGCLLVLATSGVN